MRQPGNRQQTTLLKIALQPLDYQHKAPERYTKNQLEETYLNLRQSYSYFQLQIFANVVSMEMWFSCIMRGKEDKKKLYKDGEDIFGDVGVLGFKIAGLNEWKVIRSFCAHGVNCVQI